MLQNCNFDLVNIRGCKNVMAAGRRSCKRALILSILKNCLYLRRGDLLSLSGKSRLLQMLN